MAWFMKFDGVDGEFSHADRFDFSQLTTEPTEPLATAFPGFAGGVRVASGDVNGDDDKPDLLVGRSGSDWTLDFQPELTTEPTAPGEDVMCQNNLKIGDDFIIIDYKPTESVKADDNFLVVNWLAEDHFKVDPSDPSVDPTNPNVDLRPMETPGPDDNVGLPAVQMDDGLLVPPSNVGGVSVGCGDVDGDTDALGDPVTFTYTVRVDASAYEGSHVLYQDVFVPPLETGPALAIEAVTIVHEGYWL